MNMHRDSILVQGNTFSNVVRSIEMRDVNNAHCQSFVIENNSFLTVGPDTNAGIILDSDTHADNADHHTGIIRYNYFNGVRGRAIDGFMGHSSIYYNVIANVTDGGASSAIGLEVNGPSNVVYNNVFYSVANIGVMFNNDPEVPDAVSIFKNNIVYTPTANRAIWVTTGHPGITTDNNVFWPGAGATKYYWEGTDYTFTNWKTQSGGDAASVEADPLLVSSSDFRLQAGSPAINAGIDVGLTQDFTGRFLVGLPDIGAYEFGAPAVYHIGPPKSDDIRYYPPGSVPYRLGPN
jgi:hypothetical protein